MAFRVEAEVGLALAALPRARPAGERARLLAHVAFRVAVALAEREELHQLATVVLVRRVLAVVRAGQPDQHRRVRGDRDEEPVEAPERVAAQQPVLGEHQLLRADAGVRGGEPVVPDECHPLDERTARPDHPVEPPEMIVTPRVGGCERASLVVARPRADPALAGRMRERADGAVEAETGEARGLAPARAEPGAPEETLGFGMHRTCPCSVGISAICSALSSRCPEVLDRLTSGRRASPACRAPCDRRVSTTSRSGRASGATSAPSVRVGRVA